jgi:hypothetical protein
MQAVGGSAMLAPPRKEVAMRTHEFWRERKTGLIWAVALTDGVVVGRCGPLTWSEVDDRFLPTFNYVGESAAEVEANRESYELFDPATALR